MTPDDIKALRRGTKLECRAADALESAAALISRLREALEPFAEVARWAERNGHDLSDFDMLLRGPGKEIAGHLHAQSQDFIQAANALARPERKDAES